MNDNIQFQIPLSKVFKRKYFFCICFSVIRWALNCQHRLPPCTAHAHCRCWFGNVKTKSKYLMYLTKFWNYRNYKSFSLIQSHWRESCIKLFFQIDIFLNKETTSKVLYYLNRTTSAIVPLERSCFESFLVLILAQKATLMMMRYLTAFHHGIGSYFTIYIFSRSHYKGTIVWWS